MNNFIKENIGHLEVIITELQTNHVSYDDYFKYYYMAVHETTQGILGINELKNCLIHATVDCTNEKEIRSVAIIKHSLMEMLGKSR